MRQHETELAEHRRIICIIGRKHLVSATKWEKNARKTRNAVNSKEKHKQQIDTTSFWS